jgi:hypothetical protein
MRWSSSSGRLLRPSGRGSGSWFTAGRARTAVPFPAWWFLPLCWGASTRRCSGSAACGACAELIFGTVIMFCTVISYSHIFRDTRIVSSSDAIMSYSCSCSCLCANMVVVLFVSVWPSWLLLCHFTPFSIRFHAYSVRALCRTPCGNKGGLRDTEPAWRPPHLDRRGRAPPSALAAAVRGSRHACHGDGCGCAGLLVQEVPSRRGDGAGPSQFVCHCSLLVCFAHWCWVGFGLVVSARLVGVLSLRCISQLSSHVSCKMYEN